MVEQLTFLEDVSPSLAEIAKLRSLGADTPQALLAQIEAGREAFDKYVGPKQAEFIIKRLKELVGSTENLSRPAAFGQLGVPLHAPQSKTSSLDRAYLRSRDRLFEKIKHLKAAGAPADKIKLAERKLDELLNKR